MPIYKEEIDMDKKALVTWWSTSKQTNKRANNKQILHVIRIINCRNI